MSPLLGPVPADPASWRRLHDQLIPALKHAAPDAFLRRVPELAARESGSFAVPTRRRALYFEPWTDELGRVVALRA
jgi:hypothetical protein